MIGSRDIFVVVPAYNEAAAIGDVVRDLLRGSDHVVVVVDDGSTDQTAEVAKAAGATVLRHLMNRGQGAALQTGISWALNGGAEIVVTFDSDGQHVAEDVPALIGPILDGKADVALGSRFLGEADELSFGRKIVLKSGVLFTRLMSGMPVTDAHNGLRAFSRKAAARIDLRLDRMAHASELMDQVRRSGMRWVEVPVRIRYTDYSRAKGQRSLGAVRIVFDYLVGRWLR